MYSDFLLLLTKLAGQTFQGLTHKVSSLVYLGQRGKYKPVVVIINMMISLCIYSRNRVLPLSS